MDPNIQLGQQFGPHVRVPRSVPPAARTSLPPADATIWDKKWVQALYGVVLLLVLVGLDVVLAIVK